MAFRTRYIIKIYGHKKRVIKQESFQLSFEGAEVTEMKLMRR